MASVCKKACERGTVLCKARFEDSLFFRFKTGAQAQKVQKVLHGGTLRTAQRINKRIINHEEQSSIIDMTGNEYI